MSERFLIEIRMTGETISPGVVRSRDIGNIIAAIEQMLAAVVLQKNPNLGLTDDEIIVGLTAIQPGSINLQFTTPEVYEPYIAQAYHDISSSIGNRSYDKLPDVTIKALRDVRHLSTKYTATIEFWWHNGEPAHLATLSRDTLIEVETREFKGETILYGTVINVGGTHPTAKIQLLDGKFITCDIVGRERKELAKQLAYKLYAEVGISGLATWNSDWALTGFQIESLVDYQPLSSIEVALEKLGQLASPYLEKIDDLESYFSGVRYGESDE